MLKLRLKKGRAQPGNRQPTPGYQANKTYVYRSSRDSDSRELDRSADLNPDRQGIRRYRLLLAVAGFFAVILLVWHGSTLETQGRLTKIGGQSYLRSPGTYKNTLDHLLTQDIKSKSKLTINRVEIAEKMKDTFPEIVNISISTPPWSHRPVVGLQLARPALIFSSSDAKYLLDGRGIVLFDTVKFTPNVSIQNLPVVIDQTNHEIVAGKPALAEDQVNYIQQIYFQSEVKHLRIQSITLQPGGGEVFVHFSGLRYFVKLAFATDARESIGAFLAIKEKLEKQGPQPTQYIDVRVAQHAYVR